MDLAQRLESKLIPVPESGCFLYEGTTDKFNGYGTISVNGKKQKAHRVAWVLAHGEIPPGKELRHLCDVPSCCNVNHLTIGTHAENMRDVSDRKRGRSGHQKLSAVQVKEIRESSEKLKVLANRYDVSEATVSRARNFIHFK